MSEKYLLKFHDNNISWAIVKCDFEVLNVLISRKKSSLTIKPCNKLLKSSFINVVAKMLIFILPFYKHICQNH